MSKNKFHIGIVLPSIITKNGTAKQSLELAKSLTKRGHKITFLTFAYLKTTAFPEFSKFDVYYCSNVQESVIYRIVKNVSLLERIYLYMALLFISRLRKLFINKKLDILNPHDWFGVWVVGGIKNNTTIIANINDVPNRLNEGVLGKIKLKLDRKHARKIKKILVLDNRNQKAVADWLAIGKSKIVVNRSGVDMKKYQHFQDTLPLKKELGIDKKNMLVVCANLMATNRRYEDLIKAISILPKSIKKRFNVVILSKLDFDTQYTNFIKKQLDGYQLKNLFHFIDKFFSDEERMAYLKSSDVLVFPNSPQTWGLTVLEAMALGMPVIASTGSGVSEVLEDNKTALVYKDRDTKELANKLLFCIQNPKKMKLISEAGRDYVLKTFTWEKFGVKFEKVMEQCISYER